MDFRIQCPCGLAMTISEAAAGSVTKCACGKDVKIPEWTELRVRAGLPPYNVSPELLIEHILQNRELPFDNKCLRCEVPTDHLIQVLTTCEKTLVQQSGGGIWSILVATLLGGALWGALASQMRGEEKVHGRDKRYLLPLRICPDCARTLKSRQEIKMCLCAVPTYNLLLDKFPDAEISLQPV